MSTKAKTQAAVQLAPRVTVFETNPHSFLVELEKLIVQGYRIDFQEEVAQLIGYNVATLALPDTTTA